MLPYLPVSLAQPRATGRVKQREHARQKADSLGATVSFDKLYRMKDALDDGRIAKLQELVAAKLEFSKLKPYVHLSSAPRAF